MDALNRVFRDLAVFLQKLGSAAESPAEPIESSQLTRAILLCELAIVLGSVSAKELARGGRGVGGVPVSDKRGLKLKLETMAPRDSNQDEVGFVAPGAAWLLTMSANPGRLGAERTQPITLCPGSPPPRSRPVRQRRSL